MNLFHLCCLSIFLNSTSLYCLLYVLLSSFCITGAMKSWPTVTMEAILDLFERNFSTVITGREDWSERSKREVINNYSLWYVDGSKNTQGTGIWVWGPGTSIFEPLGTNTSIVQAEIFAINRCAQYIHDRGATHRRLAILSDSQAAVRALTWMRGNP